MSRLMIEKSRFIYALASAVLVASTSCGGIAGPTDERSEQVTQEVRVRVCRSSTECRAGEHCTTDDGVCNPSPNCRPGRPCPAVCYGTCEAKPVLCGPTTCPAGQVCCNASCGICTPPGGVCTQQICDPPPAGPCRS